MSVKIKTGLGTIMEISEDLLYRFPDAEIIEDDDKKVLDCKDAKLEAGQ